MNGKFTHYLITRFNVPVKNWNKDKAGHKVLDDAWMEERIGLFKKYCVPTIANQSLKKFTWLIYCDLKTSPQYLASIQQAIISIPGATIRYVDHFDHLLIDLRQLLSEDPSLYVITSRLDNDDGLGPQFISDIQAHFTPTDKMIINFTKGVLYDATKHIVTEIRFSRFNHYGSLIEEKKPGHPLITVVGYPHGQPPEGHQVINIASRFSWLKIIHERNMASKTNGVPLQNKRIIAHFNLRADDLTQSWVATGIFVVSRLLSRMKRKLFPTPK
jgi:hypothetical protein